MLHDVLSALAHMHAQHVVHNDIKLGNIAAEVSANLKALGVALGQQQRAAGFPTGVKRGEGPQSRAVWKGGWLETRTAISGIAEKFTEPCSFGKALANTISNKSWGSRPTLRVFLQPAFARL